MLRNLSLFLAASTLTTTAFAQQFNVIQVKGNRAIIEVQTGEKLKVGESYSVGKSEFGEDEFADVKSKRKGQRKNLIGLNFSLSNLKPDTTNAKSTTIIESTIKYGWNLKQYEVAPLVTLSFTKPENTDASTTIGFGAAGSYNFQQNVPGTELIFSADAQLILTSTKTPTASGNGTAFLIGPGAKWFSLSNDYAIAGGVYLSMDKQSIGNSNFTTSGLVMQIGLSNYF